MSKDKTRELDRIASGYKDRFLAGWEGLYRQKRKLLAEKLARFFRGGRALEMGVADGEMTRALVPHFDELTLLDGARAHLDEVVAGLDPGERRKVRAVHSLFEDYVPDRPFDAVLMTHVVEHWSDPVGMLSRARTWLAPGGLAFVATPNSRSLHRHVGAAMGLLSRPDALNDQDRMMGHVRVYNPTLLRRHLRRAGFSIVAGGGLMVKPLSNRQIEAQWPPDLIKAFFDISDAFPDICSEIFVVAEAAKEAPPRKP